MKYVVLKCQPSQTLSVVRQMRADGVEAWTPTEMRRVKGPRGKGWTRKAWPALPSFLFVPDGQLHTIPKGVSELRVNGKTAIVGLSELRELEDAVREASKEDRKPRVRFWTGDRVKINSSIFGYREGTIISLSEDPETTDRLKTIVSLPVGYADVGFEGSNVVMRISVDLLEKL